MTAHLRTTVILLVCFSIVSIVNGQKLFQGYRILDIPRSDSAILGKIFNSGAIIGDGILLSNTRKFSSLSELGLKDTLSFVSNIDLQLKNYLTSKIGLTKAKITDVSLKNLEVWDCINPENLSFTEGKQSYIISIVYAKDIDITLDKEFDLGIQAELDSSLRKALNIKPTFQVSRNKASTKLGKELAMAVKLLHVTKSVGYVVPNISISDNRGAIVKECKTCMAKSIIFQDLAEFAPMQYPALNDTNRVKRYRGCFNMKMIHTGQTENGKPKESVLLICPQCNEMTGPIKPNCQDYNPNVNLYGNNIRSIMATKIGRNELEVFFVSLANLKANYVAAPNAYQFSNYRIGQITADIIFRKNRLTYKLD